MLLDPKKPRKRAAPPKPEPVETDEEFAVRVLDDYGTCETTAADAKTLAPLIATRDAALVAEAEARGAREAIDYLEYRIAAYRRGVSLRDARDLAVSDLLRKYTKGGAGVG